ncbi:MAG: LysR family transcriptional regulator [Gammaproteobacteria bacterium]|nr:LysR family transcriptional regulator [Gammaproteobacteria bacterium]
MIKLTHLRCFVTVAECGSISTAAKRLHRSPSAISMTLTNLEATFGRNLFEADGKSHLTPFGSYVFSIASEQVNRFEHAIDKIQAYANNGFGRVDIATVPSFAVHYLPSLLSKFNQAYPQITLTIRDDSSPHINQLVIQGEIDIGIASPVSEDSELMNYQPLLADPLGVVCSPGHALAKLGRPLLWQDLRGQTFIANGICHQIQDPEFQKIVAEAEIDVQNTTSILAMVAANVGVTTLPRLAIPEDRKDVVFLTTAYETLHRSIGILTPVDRSLSPASAAFVEIATRSLQSKTNT